MILSAKHPITFTEIKELYKTNDHIKEQARIRVIQQAIRAKLANPDLGEVNLRDSTYFNSVWDLKFFNDENMSLNEFLFLIFERGDFKNVARNENVYFYRLLNVARNELSEQQFNDALDYFLKSPNELLVSNVSQYVTYQRKIKEIEDMLDAGIYGKHLEVVTSK